MLFTGCGGSEETLANVTELLRRVPPTEDYFILTDRLLRSLVTNPPVFFNRVDMISANASRLAMSVDRYRRRLGGDMLEQFPNLFGISSDAPLALIVSSDAIPHNMVHVAIREVDPDMGDLLGIYSIGVARADERPSLLSMIGVSERGYDAGEVVVDIGCGSQFEIDCPEEREALATAVMADFTLYCCSRRRGHDGH